MYVTSLDKVLNHCKLEDYTNYNLQSVLKEPNQGCPLHQTSC